MKKVFKSTYPSIALVVAWMILIFLFSAQNAGTSSAQSAVIVHAINTVAPGLLEDTLTFLTRKAAHAFMFFILGALLWNAVRQYDLKTKNTIWISAILACSYAMSDEIHQTFVPGRSGEIRDVIIDTIAASIGIMICTWLYHRYRFYRR